MCSCIDSSSPKSTDEVSAILALANRLRFPLWITSKGKNLGYSLCLLLSGFNGFEGSVRDLLIRA